MVRNLDDFDSRRGFQEGGPDGGKLGVWRCILGILACATQLPWNKHLPYDGTLLNSTTTLRTSIQHTPCRQTDRIPCLSSLLIGAPLGQTDTCILNFSSPRDLPTSPSILPFPQLESSLLLYYGCLRPQTSVIILLLALIPCYEHNIVMNINYSQARSCRSSCSCHQPHSPLQPSIR